MGSLQNDKFVKVLNCKSIPIAHCQNDHGGLPSHSKIKTMPIVVQVQECTVLHEFETFNGYFCIPTSNIISPVKYIGFLNLLYLKKGFINKIV